MSYAADISVNPNPTLTLTLTFKPQNCTTSRDPIVGMGDKLTFSETTDTRTAYDNNCNNDNDNDDDDDDDDDDDENDNEMVVCIKN